MHYCTSCGSSFPIIASVCLCIITFVIVVTGILAVVVLLKVHRTVRNFHRVVELPFHLVSGLFSGMAKFRRFSAERTRGKKSGKKE